MKIVIFYSFCLCLFITTSGNTQDIPCKDWYYLKDRYGNSVTKDKCREGWQENQIGQKNGKYFLNHENGTASIRATYLNGKLNGKYIEYTSQAVITDSGRYYQGKRVGKWLISEKYTVQYKNSIISGTGRYNDKNLSLTGSLSEDGRYNGKLVLRFYPDKRAVYIIAFPLRVSPNALDTKGDLQDLVDSIVELEIYDRLNKNGKNEFLDFHLNVKSGHLFEIDKLQVKQGNTLVTDYNNEIIQSFLIKTNQHPETNYFNEMLAKTQSLSDTSHLNMYLRKYPQGLYIDQAKESIFNTLSVVKNKEMVFNVNSISFMPDSYVPDNQGAEELQFLLSFLNGIDVNGIKHFLIIGHAAADMELGKAKFNLNNKSYLLKDGKETYHTERELERIRLITSLGRSKAVYQGLMKSQKFRELENDRKVYILPVGTEFGEALYSKKRKQNIVQIVIITTSNEEINTESDCIQIGDFNNGPSISRVNQYIANHGINFNKLIKYWIGIDPEARNYMPPDIKDIIISKDLLYTIIGQVI